MSASNSDRRGLMAASGSVLAALAASACCWLPLVLLFFGASAAGLSATFQKLRPLFLSLTAILLGAGFYLAYFRREHCAPDSACAVPNPKLRRFNKIILWLSTAMVLVFAFFPNYVGLLAKSSDLALPGGGTEHAEASQQDQDIESLMIGGMTCEACSLTVRSSLKNVPGVIDASVDFSTRHALVRIDPEEPPTADALREAVKAVGYSVEAPDQTQTQ